MAERRLRHPSHRPIHTNENNISVQVEMDQFNLTQVCGILEVTVGARECQIERNSHSTFHKALMSKSVSTSGRQTRAGLVETILRTKFRDMEPMPILK